MQSVGVRPELLKQVGIDQKLNQTIPLNLAFRDENGNTVELGQYFGQKPVILTLVYYNCPMLCTQVLNGVESGLKELPMDIGKQFNVVTVSIDPTESHVLAKVKKEMYTGMYGRPGAAEGWHFLTGDEPQIKQLADARGIPLRVRSRHQAIRACQRDHDADAGRQNFALLLRDSIPVARFAAGIGGSVRGKDRDARGSGSAVLLPLRSGDRKIRLADFARDAGRRSAHGISFGIGMLILFRGEHYALPQRKV